MDLTSQVTRTPAASGRRRVRVPGREEIGEVVQGGKNVGSVYCVAVYFPSTGECVYYEQSRVEDV